MIHEKDIQIMTDEDLAITLQNLGIKVGPITDTTRLVYERKLANLLVDILPVTTPASEFSSLGNSTPRHNSSTMISENVKAMTNEDLATTLRNSGVTVGPITDTTRLVYERKLARLLQDLPPVTTPAEEYEENEEEETLSQSLYEEKSSERPYDLSTKVTRSVTRRSRRGASPPPDDVTLNKLRSSRKKGGKTQKLSPEEELPNSILEKVKLPKQSVQNSAEMKLPKPKSLPKSKLKSNIPRSSHPDYSNSTMVYPGLKKAQKKKRSFGLSDSFHIQHDSNTSDEEEHVKDDENFVTAYNENQEVNETSSDESLDSPLEIDFDNQLTDSPKDGNSGDHLADCHFTVKNPSMTNMEYSPQGYHFSQETDFSETVHNANKPIKQSEKFSSHIPRWSASPYPDDQKTLTPLFQKPNLPASRHVGQVTSSKKSNSIWKLDPVEEQNIHRELSHVRTGSTYSPSVKYDCLPKAFREKYGKYMDVSATDSPKVKNRWSIDSLPFLSHRGQAKSSNSDSVAQVNAKKLTSAYQRFTSPLISKISGGNQPTSTPAYSSIGTPGSSQLNTSLTRRPLSSMREEVKFTSLRNSQATSSASASSIAPKKGMSLMVKLLILIVFGLIAWLIYINFESAATKPLLTTSH